MRRCRACRSREVRRRNRHGRRASASAKARSSAARSGDGPRRPAPVTETERKGPARPAPDGVSGRRRCRVLRGSSRGPFAGLFSQPEPPRGRLVFCPNTTLRPLPRAPFCLRRAATSSSAIPVRTARCSSASIRPAPCPAPCTASTTTERGSTRGRRRVASSHAGVGDILGDKLRETRKAQENLGPRAS